MGAVAKNSSVDLLALHEALVQNSLPPASSLLGPDPKESMDSIKKQLRLNKGGSICKMEKYCAKK